MDLILEKEKKKGYNVKYTKAEANGVRGEE